MRSWVRAWLDWSFAYFVVSLGIAMVAHGTDMDQLTSRSALSRAAAVVDRLLWGPYHWAGRILDPDPRQMHLTTPLLLALNTCAWGALLAAAWQVLWRLRRTTGRP